MPQVDPAKGAALEQLDRLLSAFRSLIDRTAYEDCSDLNGEVISEFCSGAHAAVDRIAGLGSSYSRLSSDLRVTSPRSVRPLGGILRALRQDVESGAMTSLRELVSADVLADFSDMAAHLLAAGYKDASAVTVGAILERHLRALSTKHGVAVAVGGVPRKADSLNADLGKSGVYNMMIQKQVLAWLDLRNKAAHGQYEQYDAKHVETMLSSVMKWVADFPA